MSITPNQKTQAKRRQEASALLAELEQEENEQQHLTSAGHGSAAGMAKKFAHQQAQQSLAQEALADGDGYYEPEAASRY